MMGRTERLNTSASARYSADLLRGAVCHRARSDMISAVIAAYSPVPLSLPARPTRPDRRIAVLEPEEEAERYPLISVAAAASSNCVDGLGRYAANWTDGPQKAALQGFNSSAPTLLEPHWTRGRTF